MRPIDCHSHIVKDAGFIIALDGEPYFPGTFRNAELSNLPTNQSKVFYITKSEIGKRSPGVEKVDFLKFHCRREGYTLDDVGAFLEMCQPRVAFVDSLNLPYQTSVDYAKLFVRFPEQLFILCHTCGSDIAAVLPHLIFLKNVYFDFSFTAQLFLDDRRATVYGGHLDAARYLATSSYSASRLLFGTDEPFASEESALRGYLTAGASVEQLNRNFFDFQRKIDGKT